MNTVPTSISLNAQDRCDRCRAQAQAVYYKGALELMFCAHCMRQHNEKLEETGWQAQFDYVGLERLTESEHELAVN